MIFDCEVEATYHKLGTKNIPLCVLGSGPGLGQHRAMFQCQRPGNVCAEPQSTCDEFGETCVCDVDYTGYDCSIEISEYA